MPPRPRLAHGGAGALGELGLVVEQRAVHVEQQDGMGPGVAHALRLVGVAARAG